MGVKEMKQAADFIDRAIQNRRNDEALAEIAKEVATLCERFPLYRERLQEA